MKLELVGLLGFFEKGICKLIQGECYPNATLRQRPNEWGQLCENWWFFDSSLLPRNMNRDNSAHNHWFLNNQTKKIDISQVVASDEDICGQNENHPLQPFPCITYYYYIHTLVTLSEDDTHPWKLVP